MYKIQQDEYGYWEIVTLDGSPKWVSITEKEDAETLARLFNRDELYEEMAETLTKTLRTLNQLRNDFKTNNAILETLDGHWGLWTDIETVLAKIDAEKEEAK